MSENAEYVWSFTEDDEPWHSCSRSIVWLTRLPVTEEITGSNPVGCAATEYGALLFAKMKQDVFRRHRIESAERVPHFLFIDEFQILPNPRAFKDCLCYGPAQVFEIPPETC